MNSSADKPVGVWGTGGPASRRPQYLILGTVAAAMVYLLLDLALGGPVSRVPPAQGFIVHLISEWTTLLFALGTFLTVTVRFTRDGEVPAMVVAMGLLLAGLGDGVHAIQSAGFLPPPLDPEQWCATNWSTGRTLSLMFLAYAGLCMGGKTCHRRWRVALPVTLTLGIGLVVSAYLASRLFGATVTFPDAPVARPLDLVPALMAVALLIVLPLRRESWWRLSCLGVGVYASLFPFLLGQILLGFGARTEFDGPFLVAHLLKLAVFGLPLVGAMLDYGESLRKTRQIEEHLANAAHRLDESHRNRESMLSQQERRFRSVFEASIDPIILVRLDDFRILDANPSAGRLLGYDRRELCDLNAEVIHPHEMERLRTFALGAAAEAGSARSTEFSCLTRCGEKVPVEVSASFFRGPDGVMVLVAAVRDLRARLAGEAHQRELEANLAQADRVEAVGRLAAGVAHDFNSLLTVILGISDDLLEQPDLPPDVRQAVQMMGEAGGKASTLTQQLLTYSRRQTLSRKPLDLNVAVAGIEALLRRALPASVTLRVAFLDSPAWVDADPGGIDQVVMNLGLNARDAMPRGGELVVSVVRESAEDGKDTDRLGIRVADRGEGIPEEILPYIFEPFFTSKSLGKGTGLGLATVQGIAHQHGGVVSVLPNPGGGTIFELLLPARDAGNVVSAVANTPEPVAGSLEGVHVILVDDDEMVRASMVRTLGRQGMTVVTTDSSVNALRRLESHGPELFDLLITDVVMPGMSGIELARTVAARWPFIRILLMSGYSPEGLQPEDDRTFTFLAKPFTTERLLEIVVRTLQPDPAHLAVVSASESIVQVMADRGGAPLPRRKEGSSSVH